MVEDKKKKRLIVAICAILLGVFLYFFILPLVPFLIAAIQFKMEKPEIIDDIARYEECIGINAEDRFRNKHGVSDSIFPEKITQGMEPLEFKMTYYNPWEEQYLSYLTIRYSDDMYENEKDRLISEGVDEYKGIYSVQDVPNGYNLLALNADANSGFVYAITPDNKENIITYVEIIFAPYYIDLNVKDYIPEKYLLYGFDASKDNEYRKKYTR